jgi:hypothetical protein
MYLLQEDTGQSCHVQGLVIVIVLKVRWEMDCHRWKETSALQRNYLPPYLKIDGDGLDIAQVNDAKVLGGD